MRLGIDVGSTTVKVVVIDEQTKEVLYSKYVRHNAKQRETVIDLLKETKEKFPFERFGVAVCGSGGRTIANKMDVHFIQEVVANSAAVRALYPDVLTAIELGGQDAKVVFFYYDEEKGQLQTSDMRMNGICAGGTGAFIDEIAKLLNVKTEEFEQLAEKGETVYDISGRCGVFAKTDIQPLLLSGAKKEDIALSTFHAIAKQTIGGLAQGLPLKPPIIFEGGPLTFNKTLVKVFAERLELKEDEVIIPDHPETIVALGTAMAIDSLFPKDVSEGKLYTLDELIGRLENAEGSLENEEDKQKPFFTCEEEKEQFMVRHDGEIMEVCQPEFEDGCLKVYLGIDSGSTTSKFVLLDQKGRVVDRFYANNNGEPLIVVRDGLNAMKKKYRQQGIELVILGIGTTGYGENMLARAFGADYHTVETVAHSIGCNNYYPDATFVLDIGGQDMKAIWLKDGIITNIMLNEACSSGCGSFLENFASNLNIKVEDLAETAFSSADPAKLGSRCTVFMNSTIITEQQRGKKPNDIVAGLCRSIIENVFTKVVRIADTSELGDNIVVQGGTFKNRAVLRALEEYLGREVKIAPYPGEMGAVGAALSAKREIEDRGYANGKSTAFIGFDALENFNYETQTGAICNGCANRCSRTILTFSTGQHWVSGNRCERGALILDDDTNPKQAVKASAGQRKTTPEAPVQKEKGVDMFAEREKMLFADYPYEVVSGKKDEVIGLPRILEFWDSMPFWSTFFKALGYEIKFSPKSSRKMYEQGLEYVASDTICFPAKLVHGHVWALSKMGVDRIFFPYVMHMPPEGVDKNSPYVCSVLQGYPMVVRNSQDPEKGYGVKFDTPIFHWFSEKNREDQILKYALESLGVTKKEAEAALGYGRDALLSFRQSLKDKGQAVIDEAHRSNSYAVVLAGRPYHNDPFINHDINKKFTEKGISVLTVDSLPPLSQQDLKNTKVEITNNFHTRMLEAARVCAGDSALEYVQIVSFGCGHDAILSDEIVRIMNESGGKSPLILKVDESDASGSLGIRIQSFVETIEIRRHNSQMMKQLEEGICDLPAPSPYKFYKKDKKKRTLIVPNISKEVSVLLAAILEKENFVPKTVPLGTTKQIKLGKKYVHNDICFPAQMVIGEAISELQEGNYDQDEVAVAMIKFQCDCRMSHYAGLLRKGLDKAGFEKVPIVTTDVGDPKDMHPGVYLLGVGAALNAIWSFLMLDIILDLSRKIRPYEINKGQTNKVLEECVDLISDGIKVSIPQAKKNFVICIDKMKEIPYDRSHLKPRVFVTGELLVTYHPGSNFHIEEYLEANGMETIFPRVTDQLRKDFDATGCEIKDYGANIFPYPALIEGLISHVQNDLEKVAIKHELYEYGKKPKELYAGVKDIIPETLSCGEGWLMAAEIDEYARQGVKSHVILQPFGCLPNHVCGRGVIKRLKERYPGISILPLDLDPDTSYTNVENRLQMLIMNEYTGDQSENNQPVVE